MNAVSPSFTTQLLQTVVSYENRQIKNQLNTQAAQMSAELNQQQNALAIQMAGGSSTFEAWG